MVLDEIGYISLKLLGVFGEKKQVQTDFNIKLAYGFSQKARILVLNYSLSSTKKDLGLCRPRFSTIQTSTNHLLPRLP